jgi:NAD(P)-dependent dehydrogenase (short-subunit alcohol dehydrogenase family)
MPRRSATTRSRACSSQVPRISDSNAAHGSARFAAAPTTTAPATAIFGAGPGLGLATARFFGRQGHRVALVARHRERLDGFVKQLAGEGITVSAHVGDIGDPARFDEAAAAVNAALGPLDVAVYQTTAPSPTSASPLEVTADGERPYVEQALLTPIHAAHTLLAPMLERGGGALLVTLGASARGPIPQMSQAGPALAGLRHHLFGLAEAAAPHGVRVGILTIGGLILGSDLHHDLLPDAGPDFPGALDPDELATHLGDLLTGDDHPERLAGPYVRQAAV